MGELLFVKYCPLCGAVNPRQQAFCLACLDGDLSTVPVEPRREEAAAPLLDTAPCPAPAGADACVLALVDDPTICFTIREGQTVGRTERADIILCGVPKLDWISSTHARFLRRGAQWYIQHVGHTNFIKVDGEQFDGQEEVAIFDGSIVVLSLTAFRVTLGDA